MLIKSRAVSQLSLIGCLTAFSLNSYGQPEVPAIDRHVNPIENNHLTRSGIPPINVSRDGRIGFEAKSVAGNYRFYLLTPEKVTVPLIHSQAGPHQLMASPSPYLIASKSFVEGKKVAGGGHPTLCDPTATTPKRGDKVNPYACGIKGDDDCYDLVMMTPSKINPKDRHEVAIFQTPFTVRVSRPKTPTAEIAEITTTATPKVATHFTVEDRLLETRIAGDGRLLVAREGGPNVYSAYSNNLPACEFKHFKSLKHLSSAHDDPIARSQFGFAKYPMRYADGTRIPSGASLGGTYPWIDAKGDNLMITTVGARLSWNDSGDHRYPARCVSNTECRYASDSSNRYRGHAMVGLWTNGKVVQMDNLLNHTDYGMSADIDLQRWVSLYQPNSNAEQNHSGEVRVGGGRFNGDNYRPIGSASNSAFFDSIENRFNFWPAMRPASFADVAWTMSNAKYTDEFVFDPYTNPDALIVASWVALSTPEGYFDGWDKHTKSFSGELRFQNGAAAPAGRWTVPAYGKPYGNVRVEPVANGGIKGKGLWLDGESRVAFDIPKQPQSVSNSDWYVGIFVDSRFNGEFKERQLLAFPDGSSLHMKGRKGIVFRDAQQRVVWRKILQPRAFKRYGWTHLGLQIQRGGKSVAVYHNGMLSATWRGHRPIFQLSEGEFTVGGSADTKYDRFRGWVDDLVVFAQHLNPELACNQARGTLVGLPSHYSGQLSNATGYYPNASHQAISNLLENNHQNAFARYACYHDYSSTYAASTHSIPEGVVPVREPLLFPEGALLAHQPRPDSTQNAFCLSCHYDKAEGGLGLDALTYRSGLNAHADPRRQPGQPWIGAAFGNIPAHWLARYAPVASHKSSTSGKYNGRNIDHYYLDAHQTQMDIAQQGDSSLTINLSHQVSELGETIDLWPEASDSAWGALEYTAQGLPLGVSIDPITGHLSGKTLLVGIYDPVITATNSLGQIVRHSFHWDVSGDVTIHTFEKASSCVGPQNTSADVGTAVWSNRKCDSKNIWRLNFLGNHKAQLIHRPTELAAGVKDQSHKVNRDITLQIPSANALLDAQHQVVTVHYAGEDRFSFIWEHTQDCARRAGHLFRQGRCIYGKNANFILKPVNLLKENAANHDYLQALVSRLQASATRLASMSKNMGIHEQKSGSLTDRNQTIAIKYGAPKAHESGMGKAINMDVRSNLHGDFVAVSHYNRWLIAPSHLFLSTPNKKQIIDTGCYAIYQQPRVKGNTFKAWLQETSGCSTRLH